MISRLILAEARFSAEIRVCVGQIRAFTPEYSSDVVQCDQSTSQLLLAFLNFLDQRGCVLEGVCGFLPI